MTEPTQPSATRFETADTERHVQQARQHLAEALADPHVPWPEKCLALAISSHVIARDPVPQRPDGAFDPHEVMTPVRSDSEWVELADRLCPGALNPRPAGL